MKMKNHGPSDARMEKSSLFDGEKKFDDQMVNFFVHLNQKLSALSVSYSGLHS